MNHEQVNWRPRTLALLLTSLFALPAQADDADAAARIAELELRMHAMAQGMMAMQEAPEMKELEPIMKDYHSYVDHGRREIYKVEG